MPTKRSRHSLRQTPAACIDYEMFEISELDRATDEAAAVKEVLGAPLSREAALQCDSCGLPLVVIGYDQRPIIRKLQEQRKTANTALRPIAVVGVAEDDALPILLQLSDVALHPWAPREALRTMRSQLRNIAESVDRLAVATDDRALLLLQYLCTREDRNEVLPVVDASAPLAYRYPLAEHVLRASSAETLDVLNDLAEHELLSSRLVDRLFLCPDCNGCRVPVKELCPECKTPNVGTQDSIHHFRCGYVGPESEFIAGGRPVCPKCDDELRHIGVEYNRPGRVVICHECGHWASEPDLCAWCIDCNAYYSPEILKVARVSRFRITRGGTQAAQAGRWDTYRAQLIPPADDAEFRPAHRRQRNPEAGRARENEPREEQLWNEDLREEDLEEEDLAEEDLAEVDLAEEASCGKLALQRDRSRELARSLIQVACTNHWPMAIYQAEIMTPLDRPMSPRRQSACLDAVEGLIREQLGTQDMVTRVNAGCFLILVTKDERKGVLVPGALESRINATAEIRVKISAIAPSVAAELLSEEA